MAAEEEEPYGEVGRDGGVGMKGGKEVVVEPHRNDGVFIAKGEDDALCTKSMVVGESVYGERLLTVQAPGAHVLYLGAASGTTVSHVSDIVGPRGLVYAVEFSYWSGGNLINMAKKRTNVIPIIEDPRHPSKY